MRLRGLLVRPSWEFAPGRYLLVSALRTRLGAEEFVELARNRGATVAAVRVVKLGGPYVGLGRRHIRMAFRAPSSVRFRTQIGIRNRHHRLLVALLLSALGACGGVAPDGSPTISDTPVVSGGAGVMCPEATLTVVPADMRVEERTLVPPAGPDAGIRVQYRSGAGPELTVLSGVPGEIPGSRTGDVRIIRGQRAIVFSVQPDTIVVRWLEGPEGSPCSQYAVIASGLTRAEMEQIIDGIR